MDRNRLTDILHNGDRTQLAKAWESATPAADFEPLPSGTYVARIVDGGPAKARTGTPGYKLTFEVAEGEYAGRLVWHDLWLTPAALPVTKRDLAKLGVQSFDQLDGPPPGGIVCRVKVSKRKDDNGTERNRVRTFEVLRRDPPDLDPFAPKVPPESPTANVEAGDLFPDDPNAARAGPYQEGR